MSRRFFFIVSTRGNHGSTVILFPRKTTESPERSLARLRVSATPSASYQSAGYQFVRLPSAFDQPQDFQQFVQFDVSRPAETEPFFFHCFFVTVNGGAYRAFAVAGKIRAVPVRV